ncbi:MAG TPA: hypothetical protein VK904_05425 [Miltoncostaeaceae bacterium]|nr:hypothetical protein [Miltoncostaeaceae bacterium]
MSADLVRLAASLAQCEMALVRRDPVATALLAQAARHAEDMPCGPAAAAAAALARASDPAGDSPEAAAARKVVQALVRSALIEAEAGLLR